MIEISPRKTPRQRRSAATYEVILEAAHGVQDIATAAFDLSALTKGMVEAAVKAGEEDYAALAARVSRAARGYLAV